MSIRIDGLSKKFGGHVAVQEASIEVGTGKLVALLGPSGSGKTTLLRLIAGLEFPDEGRVFFHGEEVTQKSAYERRAGFVFQHYALFQHLSVFDNIAFGLEVRPRATRPCKDEIRERVHCLLKLVQLEPFAKRFPAQLSGGQRQRVALARALAIEPRVLLLDEPFGALDAKVRKELRAWLRRFHDETQITSLFVTHDQEEAFEVANEVVILNHGHIQQIGAPGLIQREPANAFVHDFLGLDFQI
jgi:sulfate transport system ATP-binding protein